MWSVCMTCLSCMPWYFRAYAMATLVIIVIFICEFFCAFFVDDLRRRVWPLLVGIDPKSVEPAPTLSELKSHPEYNQVILDVNRSLKRFPPGIPYDQRIALQDQLTVLILRVIIKYPHLKYYQVSTMG